MVRGFADDGASSDRDDDAGAGGGHREKAEAHEKSDQVLLMLEGELIGEVGEERPRLSKGDIIIIPAATKHRFANASADKAVTFNVYSPPAYPPKEKG